MMIPPIRVLRSLMFAALMAGGGFLLALASGCSSESSSPPKEEVQKPVTPEKKGPVIDLLEAMRNRLVLSHTVARSKWNQKKLGADTQLDAAMLDQLAKEGETYGLNNARVRTFFEAQFAAALQVEEADWKQWQTEKRGPFHDLPDAANVLQPRIFGFNRDMLPPLVELKDHLAERKTKDEIRERAQTVLAGDGITEAVRRTALEPLLQW